VYEISKSIDFNEITLISSDFTDFKVISLISNIYNYLNYYISNCVLPRFRTNGFICQNFVTQMVIWSWSCVTRPFIRAGRLSIGDYKRLLGAGAYNLQSISFLRLNKVWLLEIIALKTLFRILKILTPPHVSTV